MTGNTEEHHRPGALTEAAAADHQLAADVAEQAGGLLLELRQSLEGEDPARLRDEGDLRAHALISQLLATARPGDAVLSEEGFDDPRRLSSTRVWIVDPLDGTREYAEADRWDWAVHVALWCDGDLVAGAVALPALAVTLSTAAAPPPPLPPAAEPARMVVSRSRPPAVAEAVARELGMEMVSMGSAGAKAMALVLGEAEAYVHAGGQYEWDSAAPVAVARSYGLHTSRIDGTPLLYNQADPTLPDLVVCRPELAPAILSAIARQAPA